MVTLMDGVKLMSKSIHLFRFGLIFLVRVVILSGLNDIV